MKYVISIIHMYTFMIICILVIDKQNIDKSIYITYNSVNHSYIQLLQLLIKCDCKQTCARMTVMSPNEHFYCSNGITINSNDLMPILTSNFHLKIVILKIFQIIKITKTRDYCRLWRLFGLFEIFMDYVRL